MELLLVRHATAAEPEPDQPDDARPLTDEGRRRFRRVVSGLGALGVGLDLVLHSPLLRAVQTAELLEPLADGELQVTPHLAEPPGPETVQALERAATAARVALVGHQPWMSQLLAALLGARPDHADRALPFRKGGVAWLTGERFAGGMALRAFLPPQVLRALARRSPR